MDNFHNVIATMERLDTYVPSHMRNPIIIYITKGIPMGSFGTSLFAGNLYDAINRADHINIDNIVSMAKWIQCYAPKDCYGSYDIVENWQGTDTRENVHYG